MVKNRRVGQYYVDIIHPNRFGTRIQPYTDSDAGDDALWMKSVVAEKNILSARTSQNFYVR